METKNKTEEEGKEKEKAEEEKEEFSASEVEYVSYGGEHHLPLIMGLVDSELSEPFSIFTSIYGLNSLSWRFIEEDVWELWCAKWENIETHLEATLPCFLLSSPIEEDLLVMLEAEVTNKGAQALYGRLGFIRAKRLFRYYLNGVDAFSLKLSFPSPQSFLSMVAGTDGRHWRSDHIPIE